MAEQQEQNIKENSVKGFVSNKNHLVFLAFVVLSFFIWFLNYLNKNLSTDITIKYRLENIPEALDEDKIKRGEFSILAKGQGYNLLEESLKMRSIPFVINLDATTDKSKNLLQYTVKMDYAYIVADDLKPMLRKKIGDKIVIESISPDTLFFEVANGMEKKVPVLTDNVKLKLKDGEKIRRTTVVPDSITIYGQEKAIDSIKAVQVSETYLRKVKSGVAYTLDLDIPEGVDAQVNEVLLTYNISVFTQAHRKLKINALNIPEKYSVTMLPMYVDICYSVSVDNFDQVKDSDFEVSIDYKKSTHGSVLVDVVSKNPNVSIIEHYPEICNIILEKK